MLRVLLIEDDIDFAKTVVEYLNIEQINCDYVSNGVAGLNLALENTYDVILLDLNLPRLDGLSVCQKLRNAGHSTPVLMLTARDQLDDKIEGFNVGTDDYLVKPFELKELNIRIKALSRRSISKASILRCADLEMNLNQHIVTRNKQPIKLSPTTWILLETLLRHSPNAVSKQELHNTVWGDESPDSNSLKVHMHNLRNSVDHAYEKKLIKTISGYGFSINESNDEI